MIRKFIVTILALGAALGLALSAIPGTVAAHESSTSRVLGSIDVEPAGGSVMTTNGDIDLGPDARIDGNVFVAEVLKFSGDHPPIDRE